MLSNNMDNDFVLCGILPFGAITHFNSGYDNFVLENATYNVYFTMYNVHLTVYHVSLTIYHIHLTMCSIYLTMYYINLTVYHI